MTKFVITMLAAVHARANRRCQLLRRQPDRHLAQSRYSYVPHPHTNARLWCTHAARPSWATERLLITSSTRRRSESSSAPEIRPHEATFGLRPMRCRCAVADVVPTRANSPYRAAISCWLGVARSSGHANSPHHHLIIEIWS